MKLKESTLLTILTNLARTIRYKSGQVESYANSLKNVKESYDDGAIGQEEFDGVYETLSEICALHQQRLHEVVIASIDLLATTACDFEAFTLSHMNEAINDLREQVEKSSSKY